MVVKRVNFTRTHTHTRAHAHTRSHTHTACTLEFKGGNTHLTDWSKTQTWPLLLVQGPHCRPTPALRIVLCPLVDLCWILVESSLFLPFLARLMCPSAHCRHFLQSHSTAMCWLNSPHKEAAATLPLICTPRHFALGRDSLWSRNLFGRHTLVWLSLATPLS